MASTGLQIAALVWILLIFVATAYFTRATRRRIVASLMGAASGALVGVVVDIVAHDAGWWTYRNVSTPYGPPLFYVASGLGFGALTLVAWRLMRRFGWRGLIGELAVLMLYGPPRDYLLADLPGLMDFRWSTAVVVLDSLLVWAIPFMIAVALMRLLGGQSRRDLLARNPSAQTLSDA